MAISKRLEQPSSVCLRRLSVKFQLEPSGQQLPSERVFPGKEVPAQVALVIALFFMDLCGKSQTFEYMQSMSFTRGHTLE